MKAEFKNLPVLETTPNTMITMQEIGVRLGVERMQTVRHIVRNGRLRETGRLEGPVALLRSKAHPALLFDRTQTEVWLKTELSRRRNQDASLWSVQNIADHSSVSTFAVRNWISKGGRTKGYPVFPAVVVPQREGVPALRDRDAVLEWLEATKHLRHLRWAG